MLNVSAPEIISEFLRTHEDVFTSDEFCKYCKSQGVRISKAQADDLLRTSDFVFPLVKNEFITRAGVFLGRWFSFKPSKEEVSKGQFIIGHRCMPFISTEIAPDSITVISNNDILKSHETVFSLNLAFDVFALYGEGYVIPYVFNDKANKTVPMSSVQYGMPQEITLTSWSLKDISGKKEFKYGDRILCRVIDWDGGIVEMYYQQNDSADMVVSKAAIQRQEWYSHFENGLLESFDKNGPSGSIEEQLALLFLENQEILCVKNCGSCEEFLRHTKKIGFSSYGVESRIWRTGELVPYVGAWNEAYAKDLIMSDISMTFTPQIIDAYLENNIYENLSEKIKKSETLEEVVQKIFPNSLKMTPEERKIVLLNIEKRHDILKKNYDPFSDYKIAPLRKRIIEIFSEVSALLCDIGTSGVKAIDFPQQELVVLTQLFSHIVRLLEEVENVLLRDNFPLDDVEMSLQGMEDTFDGICGLLRSFLESNRSKGFELVT